MSDRLAEIAAYEHDVAHAAEALTAVLLNPHASTYQPERAALLTALDWLTVTITCGDCVEGRCHGHDEDAEECGCARHEASVEARERRQQLRDAGVLAHKAATDG